MYDFDRTDDAGNTRELHTDLALDAIDFTYHDDYKTRYEDKTNEPVELVTCPYFRTSKLHFNRKTIRDYSGIDSFVIYVCMDGALDLGYSAGEIRVEKGEAILVPACEKKITLNPDPQFKMLESFVPSAL
jgi:mannose-6-phosphate isomerase